MDSFKKFSEDKLPDRCEYFSSLKGECIIKKIKKIILCIKNIIYMLLMTIMCLK